VWNYRCCNSFDYRKEFTAMSTSDETRIIRGRLPILRSSATAAAVLGAIFLLCWVGAALGWLSASHMYLALFTSAPPASLAALGAGLGWSIVFGGLAGALVALAYNAFSFLER
jgi:hypothetical protein